MLYFRKKQIKMSLINDYVFLMCVKNFCNNSFDCFTYENQQIKTLSEQNHLLFQTYNKIFEKLKMNDISLLILKKETKHDNSIFLNEQQNNFISTNETIKQLQAKQNILTNELGNKLEMLKLTLV